MSNSQPQTTPSLEISQSVSGQSQNISGHGQLTAEQTATGQRQNISACEQSVNGNSPSLTRKLIEQKQWPTSSAEVIPVVVSQINVSSASPQTEVNGNKFASSPSTQIISTTPPRFLGIKNFFVGEGHPPFLQDTFLTS
jgi:hypothetical protein